MTVRNYLKQFRTPKTVLAEMIGISRIELYAYLDPKSYPRNPLSGEKLRLIAEFEGRSFRAVCADYRKAAA